MSTVTVSATIENEGDRFRIEAGWPAPEGIRRIEVEAAVVDLGSNSLSLPTHIIRGLGLIRMGKRPTRTGRGVAEVSTYGPVRLTVRDRDCTCDAIEGTDDSPVSLGGVNLLMLDLVVDPEGRGLIGNPEHGGEPMIELY